MAFNARVLSVFIASPGDTMLARDQVENTIASWNRLNAPNRGVVLLPLRWEHNAVPELGGHGGQAVVNKQLVARADIVVALFHTRLGSPTDRAESGTAEEINEAREQGTPVHVYFSREPLPYDADTAELDRVREYERSLRSEGLLGDFSSLEDLDRKVFAALDADVGLAMADSDAQPDEPTSHARFRIWLDKSGKSERLVVENIGDGPAYDLQILKSEPVGRGSDLSLIDQEPIAILQPQNSVRWLTAIAFGTAAQHTLVLGWSEGGEKYEESHSLSIF